MSNWSFRHATTAFQDRQWFISWPMFLAAGELLLNPASFRCMIRGIRMLRPPTVTGIRNVVLLCGRPLGRRASYHHGPLGRRDDASCRRSLDLRQVVDDIDWVVESVGYPCNGVAGSLEGMARCLEDIARCLRGTAPCPEGMVGCLYARDASSLQGWKIAVCRSLAAVSTCRALSIHIAFMFGRKTIHTASVVQVW